MKTEVVIARYNEDVSWAKGMPNVCVYNKGGALSGVPCLQHAMLNEGREAGTYLSHIISRYDSLADVTLFCQGQNDDHNPAKFPIEQLLDLPEGTDVMGLFRCDAMVEWDESGRLKHPGKWGQDCRDGRMKLCPRSFTAWWADLFGQPPSAIQGISYFPGAVFAVRREVLHRQSRGFYEKLGEQLRYHPYPEEALFLERAWLYLWKKPALKVSAVVCQSE
jgi:hypothetical protein